MDSIQKLTELFKEFPGIGPRQAKRFVYFLLNKNSGYASDLSRLILDVRSTVHSCQMCFRYFPNSKNKICSTCLDVGREKKYIMIVPNDIDYENIEKTKFFNGYYFILGGVVPILEKNPEKKIRQKELLSIISERIKNGLEEIIISMNYNPEGENTLSYLKDLLSRFNLDSRVKISTLGRGLSTGTELEYSDSETIKNALKNRQ